MSDSKVIEECLSRMKELVRQVSLTRIKQHGASDGYGILEVPHENALDVFNHWMALILISGKSVRITFKVHFNIRTAQEFAAPVYGKNPDDIEMRQAKDFVKEFCNLSAGFIKKIFEDQNLDVGISLPLVIRGFDEVFFDKSEKETITEDSFKLDQSGNGLICSSHIEVFNHEMLQVIDTNIEEEEEEEIDFL
jgi:CheY-specific phosphatase CheX